MILVYTTHPSREEADKITQLLFNKKLIACGNYSTVSSQYLWKGELKSSEEIVALYKTLPEKWEEIKNTVTELHPYDVPCILKIEVAANESFENWAAAEL